MGVAGWILWDATIGDLCSVDSFFKSPNVGVLKRWSSVKPSTDVSGLGRSRCFNATTFPFPFPHSSTSDPSKGDNLEASVEPVWSWNHRGPCWGRQPALLPEGFSLHFVSRFWNQDLCMKQREQRIFKSLLLIILTYCYLGLKGFFSWKCLGVILKERSPPSDTPPPLKLIIPFTAAVLLVWI